MALSSDYRRGLEKLRNVVQGKVTDEAIRERFEALAGRLTDNLDKAELFGDDAARSAQRSEFIFNLNIFTRKHFNGVAFTDICEGRVKPEELTLTKDEGNGGTVPTPSQSPKKHIRLTESEYDRFVEIVGKDALREQYEIEYLKEPVRVTLRFEPTSDGARITWEGDAFGTIKSDFTYPYKTEDLAVVVKALDAQQRHNYKTGEFCESEQKTLTDYGLWKSGRVVSNVHEIVGRKIFEALTASRESYAAISAIRGGATSVGTNVAYVLRFPEQAIQLAALPWEAMWDMNKPLLLSQGGTNLDQCERYIDVSSPVRHPLARGKKLHILALVPHSDMPENIRQEEKQAREQVWQTLENNGLLEWEEMSPVTMVRLNQRMRQEPRPDIIHYFGHGTYKDGKGHLVLDNHPENPTGAEWVDSSRLAAQLGEIRLIMLQACQSARVGEQTDQGGIVTGLAPALSMVSEVVVAMQLAVRIPATIQFHKVFYEEITRGRSIQSAVAEARRFLYVTESDGASWYVPTLYIRTRDQKPVYIVQP